MNAITFNKQLQGRVQAIWKLWFQKVKLSNLHKIVRRSNCLIYIKSGENREKDQQNREKSVLAMHPH